MKKKVWLLIAIGLLLLIGIGGKVSIDMMEDRKMKKEQKAEAELIEVEKMSVVALKNTFADIKSVEFEKSGYDLITGSSFMFVKMTNQDGESVRFSYCYETNKPSEIRGYMLEDEEVQIEGTTKNKVYVIYSNNDEGEV